MSGGKVSSRVLTRAAEENPREFFVSMFREGFQSTKKADWVISGVPMAFFNPVMRTEFPEVAAPDIKIMVAKFDPATSPISWWVTPFTRPKSLADQLLANGFKFEETIPAMSLPLERLKAPTYPLGLAVKEARSPKELLRWFRVVADAFEIPAKVTEELYRGMLKKLKSPDGDVVNYSGYIGRRLVGTSTLFLGKSAAGLYNVTTIPSARGKGIGSAITHFTLSEAHRRGFRIGTLQSSKAGYGIYKKLGFEERFKISSYVLVKPRKP